MTSPSSCYTNLFPKCLDVTYDADQAYNSDFEDYFDYLFSGIGAGTIAARGTIAPNTTSLTYICAPQIHTNLRVRFKGFIGNALNKLGKFSCVHIDSSAFGLFSDIASKSNTNDGIPAQTGVIPLDSETLASTRWAPSSDKVTGALYPKFFILYFGQAIPQGNISSDDIKSKFLKLGKGSDNWITAAIVVLETKNNIAYALHNVSNKDDNNEQDFFARHFHPKYNKKKLGPIVLGPFGFIASVDSNYFNVKAELIHNLYLPSAPSPNPIFTHAHLKTLTLQLLDNIEKEAEATKGITKSSFFCTFAVLLAGIMTLWQPIFFQACSRDECCPCIATHRLS
jgi:hypothetical protein